MLTAHNKAIKKSHATKYNIIDNLQEEETQEQAQNKKYKIVFFHKPQDMLCTFVSVAMVELELNELEQAKNIAHAVFIETGLTHALIKYDSIRQYMRLDKIKGMVQGW